MVVKSQGNNLLVDWGLEGSAVESTTASPQNVTRTTCEHCGLTLVDDGCENMLCRDNFRRQQFIIHFLSAVGTAPGGLVKSTVQRLVEEGKLDEPADIFLLDELKGIPVIASTIRKALKSAEFVKTHYGLGIPMATAKDGATLYKTYESLYDVATASTKDLEKAGLAPLVAKHCAEYFNQPDAVELLIHLDSAGFPVVYPKPVAQPTPPPQPAAPSTGQNKMNGRFVVFTGKMERTRSAMEALARQLGAYPQDKVNSSTDYLVTGARVGRVKTDAARSLGVRVITEEEFYRLAGMR